MARAPKLELGRIRSAMLSGLGLAAALTAAFSFAYVASERDKKADLAYFRTSRPGEVTRWIAERGVSEEESRRVFLIKMEEFSRAVEKCAQSKASCAQPVSGRTFSWPT